MSLLWQDLSTEIQKVHVQIAKEPSCTLRVFNCWGQGPDDMGVQATTSRKGLGTDLEPTSCTHSFILGALSSAKAIIQKPDWSEVVISIIMNDTDMRE